MLDFRVSNWVVSLSFSTAKVRQFPDMYKHIMLICINILLMYVKTYFQSFGGLRPLDPYFVMSVLQTADCITFLVASPCVCRIFFLPLHCLRIVGNAEVRPMNVKTALTAEAGGHGFNPCASPFCSGNEKDYVHQINILLIRLDNFYNNGKEKTYLFADGPGRTLEIERITIKKESV